jgi:hypothetical protein
MDKSPRYLETPPDWSADERPTLPARPQQSHTLNQNASPIFYWAVYLYCCQFK